MWQHSGLWILPEGSVSFKNRRRGLVIYRIALIFFLQELRLNWKYSSPCILQGGGRGSTIKTQPCKMKRKITWQRWSMIEVRTLQVHRTLPAQWRFLTTTGGPSAWLQQWSLHAALRGPSSTIKTQTWQINIFK